MMHKLLGLALTLSLLASGCTQKSEPVTISPPTADFTANPQQGLAPLTVAFTNLSTGDITYHHWNFGDGHFSTLSHPNHTYTAPGKYTVSLAVMGAGGSDVETKIEYITVHTGVINWEEAASYIGQTKVVRGKIVGTHYAATTRGKPTFLDFHKPYQRHFKCVIWGRDRQKFIEKFPPNPETYFLNKRVQVTGLIEEYPEGSGIPEIILTDPSQIKVIEE